MVKMGNSKTFVIDVTPTRIAIPEPRGYFPAVTCGRLARKQGKRLDGSELAANLMMPLKGSRIPILNIKIRLVVVAE